MMAGGGGGASYSQDGKPGVAQTNGTSGNMSGGNSSGSGGVNSGGGGVSSDYYGGGGGAGYTNDGGTHCDGNCNGSNVMAFGGQAYTSGNLGGDRGVSGYGSRGGWGGGGEGGAFFVPSVNVYYNGGGGGGGGYSGGGGAGGDSYASGGGGGSYHSPQVSNLKLIESDGVNFGDGSVTISGPFLSDADVDQVVDEMDNCPLTYNPGQEDLNNDGVGDACLGPVFGYQINSFQFDTIANSGWYQLEAIGAQGGSSGSHIGGKGAHMRAMVQLSQGDILKIAVGGAGGSGQFQGNNPSGGGGGGATSIVKVNGSVNTPLLFAAGGGGAGSNWDGSPGLTSINGQSAAGSGGTNGSGGGIGSDYRGGAGGAGYSGDGGSHYDRNNNVLSYGGQAYTSGNYGGNSGQIGGDGGWGGGGEGGPANNTTDGGGGGAGKIENGYDANLGWSGAGGYNPGTNGQGGGNDVNADSDDLFDGAGGGGLMATGNNIKNSSGKAAAFGGSAARLDLATAGSSPNMGGDGGFGGGGEGGVPKCKFLNSFDPDKGSGGGGGGGGYSGGGSGEHGGHGGGGGGSYSICRFTQMTAGYRTGHGTASIVGPYADSDSDNVPDSIDKCPDTPNPLQETTVSYSGSYTWKDNNGSTIGTYTDPGNYYYNDTTNCILYFLRLRQSTLSFFNDPYLHSNCTALTRYDTTIVVCTPFTWSKTGRTYSQSEEDSIRINCELWYIHLVVGPPAANGSVQGSRFVCKNATVTYSIPPAAGASSYQWTLPPLATGSSTTNSITVVFPANFAGGQLSVVPVNHCGIGNAVTMPIAVVNSAPTGALRITSPASPAVSGTYSVNAIAGANTYTWSVSSPAATIVSGQGTGSIDLQVQSGYTGTFVLQVVASNCKGNGSRATRAIVVRTPVRTQDPAVLFLEQKLMVYPNPNHGAFTVKVVPFEIDAKLEVYSMDGRMVCSKLVPGNTAEMPLDLNQSAAGLYQVRVVAGGEVRSVKVVVQ